MNEPQFQNTTKGLLQNEFVGFVILSIVHDSISKCIYEVLWQVDRWNMFLPILGDSVLLFEFYRSQIHSTYSFPYLKTTSPLQVPTISIISGLFMNYLSILFDLRNTTC